MSGALKRIAALARLVLLDGLRRHALMGLIVLSVAAEHQVQVAILLDHPVLLSQLRGLERSRGRGGEGAVREAIEMILEVRKAWPPPALDGR